MFFLAAGEVAEGLSNTELDFKEHWAIGPIAHWIMIPDEFFLENLGPISKSGIPPEIFVLLILDFSQDKTIPNITLTLRSHEDLEDFTVHDHGRHLAQQVHTLTPSLTQNRMPHVASFQALGIALLHLGAIQNGSNSESKGLPRNDRDRKTNIYSIIERFSATRSTTINVSVRNIVDHKESMILSNCRNFSEVLYWWKIVKETIQHHKTMSRLNSVPRLRPVPSWSCSVHRIQWRSALTGMPSFATRPPGRQFPKVFVPQHERWSSTTLFPLSSFFLFLFGQNGIEFALWSTHSTPEPPLLYLKHFIWMGLCDSQVIEKVSWSTLPIRWLYMI